MVASGSSDSKFGIGKDASCSGGSKFDIRNGASGMVHQEGCIGKGASGSGSSKIDIGMRVAGRQLAIGSRK